MSYNGMQFQLQKVGDTIGGYVVTPDRGLIQVTRVTSNNGMVTIHASDLEIHVPANIIRNAWVLRTSNRTMSHSGSTEYIVPQNAGGCKCKKRFLRR